MSRTRLVLVTTLCAGATIVPAICSLARAQTVAFNAPATQRLATVEERPATTVEQPLSGQTNALDSPDSIHYRKGLDLLKKHQYKKAREEFQYLINTYPDSSLIAPSYHAIGDAFYDEGGTENLLMARDQYMNFAIFFPDQSKAAEALNKAMSINRMMRTRGDNHEHVSEPESAAGKSTGQYPANDYAPVLKQYLREIQDALDKMNGAALDHQFHPSESSGLREYYWKWLNQDVVWIIYEEERLVFLNLKTDEERESFIKKFWAGRNPNPGSQNNDFKKEHYRRLAYANERFASSVPGWKTSFGRIYIKYGPASEIESGPAGGIFDFNGQLDHSMFPYELWRYRHIDSTGERAEFLFVDREGTGNYVLSKETRSKW